MDKRRSLIVVPHSDDELIACFGLIKRRLEAKEHIDLLVATAGNRGWPKELPWRSHLMNELIDARTKETRAFIRYIDSIHPLEYFNFMGIPEGHINESPFRQVLIDELNDRKKIIEVFGPHPESSHPDHKALGELLLSHFGEFYGFFVGVDILLEWAEKQKPDIEIELTTREFAMKYQLAREIYQTQKHFLPNFISRKPYNRERFWLVENLKSR